MDWTQVDIYTTTAAIDLLSVKLQDLGIRGCVVQDAQDFQEFLEQKDGKWDYLEDGLMELANCETCITVYLPVDSQGAETMAALRAMLARMKRRTPSTSTADWKFPAPAFGRRTGQTTGSSTSSPSLLVKSCSSSPAGSRSLRQQRAEPFWKSIRQAASAPDSITPPVSVWN